MKEMYAELKRQVEHVKKRRKDSKNNNKKNKKNNSNQSESKGNGKRSNAKKNNGKKIKKRKLNVVKRTIDNDENKSSNSHTETRAVIVQQNGSNITVQKSSR